MIACFNSHAEFDGKLVSYSAAWSEINMCVPIDEINDAGYLLKINVFILKSNACKE